MICAGARAWGRAWARGGASAYVGACERVPVRAHVLRAHTLRVWHCSCTCVHARACVHTRLEHEVVGGLQVHGRRRLLDGRRHELVVRLGQDHAGEQVADDALQNKSHTGRPLTFGTCANVHMNMRASVWARAWVRASAWVGAATHGCARHGTAQPPAWGARPAPHTPHLKQRHILGQELAQVDVHDGAQHEHVPARACTRAHPRNRPAGAARQASGAFMQRHASVLQEPCVCAHTCSPSPCALHPCTLHPCPLPRTLTRPQWGSGA